MTGNNQPENIMSEGIAYKSSKKPLGIEIRREKVMHKFFTEEIAKYYCRTQET